MIQYAFPAYGGQRSNCGHSYFSAKLLNNGHTRSLGPVRDLRPLLYAAQDLLVLAPPLGGRQSLPSPDPAAHVAAPKGQQRFRSPGATRPSPSGSGKVRISRALVKKSESFSGGEKLFLQIDLQTPKFL